MSVGEVIRIETAAQFAGGRAQALANERRGLDDPRTHGDEWRIIPRPHRQSAGRDIAPDKLLRLEHVIVAHQRLPEWGSPKPPMTPEALLVHYADDLDAKYHMMYVALRDDPQPGAFTSKQNQLYQAVFRGLPK